MAKPCADVAPQQLTRKSLIYKSAVEYGGMTINHVQGCAHGCRYPCYAFMNAKRFGRVSGYEEWCRPRVVANALELLERELPRYKGEVDSIHLSFTTDPFMYDAAAGGPNREILGMTTRIIEKLNTAGIRVTTLTKGVYPDEFVRRTRELSDRNLYGISLVSLDEDYRRKWEPGSAPFERRVDGLLRLSNAGCSTWVSIEPYPTPNIDPTSSEPGPLLAAIGCADRIVFGRWNYSKLVNSYHDVYGHYAGVAAEIAAWCEANEKPLLIKSGSPLASAYRMNVLEESLRRCDTQTE